MRKTFALIVLSIAVGNIVGFQAAKFGAVNPDPASPRPIDAVDTVFIEDMTWMEVRDAMKAGKDTVLIATGGIEQNGPYLVANGRAGNNLQMTFREGQHFNSPPR